MINIEEIVILNAAGVLLLLILLTFRIENKATSHLSDHLFDLMIGLTFGALILETLTFLLDGKQGTAIRILLYIANDYLFFASCAVGMLWFLYVDQRIYHSLRRLQKLLIPMAIPFLAISILLVCDLFGAGKIFYITDQNVYVRGSLVILPYILLFLYYISSVVLAVIAVKHRGHVQFFPVHFFVIPCVVGTIVQGLYYGLSVGWFCVSLSFLFIQMQLQNQNSFVDDLSGLYNRRYYNYFINKITNSKKHKIISGILIDVNHFKSINDNYGHTMGDDAIRTLGMLLSEATAEQNTAFRLAGDEFIIISVDMQETETLQLMNTLADKIEYFNRTSEKPYKLSLSMGYTICDTEDLDSDAFLHQMDMKMYKAKALYYSQRSTEL